MTTRRQLEDVEEAAAAVWHHPTCRVCWRPMVLGQHEAHAVCSSMSDAFPDHITRPARKGTKP